MQIRNKLRINTATLSVSVLAIIVVLFLTTARLGNALEAAKTADAIVTASLERLLLRTDLHRTGSERSKAQLIAKHAQIGGLLKKALTQFPDPEDSKTISELLAIHETIGKLSKTIWESREKRWLRNTPADALSLEVEERLLSQLNVKVYESILLQTRLQGSGEEAVSSSMRLAGGAVLLVLLTVSGVTLVNSVTVNRIIADRVGRLHEGAEVIGGGDLSHRIDLRGDDEFSALAVSFNEMASRLGDSYRNLEIEIEERKRAESLLRTLGDQIPGGAIYRHVQDADGKISYSYMSAGIERLFGMPAGEIVTDSERFLGLIVEDDRKRVMAAQEESAASLTPFDCEFRQRTVDGEIRWVQCRSMPRRLDNGSTVWDGVVVDVTERKQTELDLERLRNLLSDGQQIAHLGSWEYIAATGETVWSDEQKRIYGLDPAQPSPAYEAMLRNHIHPDDAAELDKAFGEALSKRSVFENENRIVRPDGSVRFIFNRAVPYLDEQGNLARYVGATLDITERKRAETALRESEEQFRVLTQNLQSAVALIDSNGKFSIVNPSFLRLFDIPQDADIRYVNNNDWAQWQVFDERGTLLDPDDHPVRKAARTGSAVKNSLVAVRSPSRPDLNWLLVSAEPVLDAQGNIHRLICSYYDITEQKRTEEALRQSQAAVQAFYDSAPLMMGLVELDDGQVIAIHGNARVAALFGAAPEELPGRSFAEIEPDPEVNALWLSAYRRCQTENLPVRFEYRQSAEGVWFNASVAPVPPAESGRPRCSFVVEDITERKRAEEALARLQEQTEGDRRRLEAILETAPAGVVMIEAADGTMSRVNRRAAEIYGTDFDGVDLREHLARVKVLLPDGSPFPAEELPVSRGLRGETARNVELTIERGDGVRVPLLVHAAPLRDAQGNITAAVILFDDITERKRGEEALHKAHQELALQMEERTKELREKEVLLKEVHHRVKNNLQVISSLVGLQADGTLDETLREGLKDVAFRVRSMALVHEKLYQSESLAFLDFAEYTRGLLGYLWRAHGSVAEGIELKLDLQPVSIPVDIAVPCALMLNELAGNSLKHAFPGGGSGEVAVSLQESEGRISLCVRDNGTGLPEGFRWRQAPTLGLRLVQMLAGQLKAAVELEKGGGTWFRIAFDLPGKVKDGERNDG